ncbi:DUF721 domain-containing protein [Candidatus Uhrbacteria bacterium]|nr:DUF721 domain-containing protein [Candidatus Uhrbacteria bacterium]
MHGLGNLLNSALNRHGIQKQVTATMVVQRANHILSSLVAGTPLADDARVVVYKNDELVVSCRHAAASYDVQPLLPALRGELERTFPDKTFSRIITRVSGEEWYTHNDL